MFFSIIINDKISKYSPHAIQLLLLLSRSVVSDSLWPHGPQHSRPPCPSPTPGACSNSCPLSRWCHPTISSSVVRFSSCYTLGPCWFPVFLYSSVYNCQSQTPNLALPHFPLWSPVSLFSVSESLFSWWVDWCHSLEFISRWLLYVICLWFHSVGSSLGPSMLLPMVNCAIFIFFDVDHF